MLLIVNDIFKDVVFILSQMSGIPVLRLLLDELVGSAANIPYRYEHGCLLYCFLSTRQLMLPQKLYCGITIYKTSL